jgi:Zn-dependent oligopeptidase
LFIIATQKSKSNMNPLINTFNTPFNTPAFGQIKNEHYEPALKEFITQAKSEITEIKNSSEPATFENTIEKLEKSGKALDRTSSIFFNLNSAETNDEMQAIAKVLSPLLTEFSNDILLDEILFNRVKSVFDSNNRNLLNPEQITLLDKTYKGFVRNGALLYDDRKTALRAIDVNLANLSLEFGEHVLAETNNYKLVIDNKNDLEGLPDFAIEQAAQDAIDKGEDGKWVITLDYPSYIPFMTYASNRALRKDLVLRLARNHSKETVLIIRK